MQVKTIQEKGKQLRLLFDERELYFVLLNDEKLEVCNVFRINHSNDAVYFTLTGLKQLDVPVKNLPLFVSGRSFLMKSPEDLFGAYFENVDYLATPEDEPNLEKRIIAEFPCLMS